MSDGFVSWFRARSSTTTFIDAVHSFEAAGIHLNHPVKGDPILLDVDGDAVSTTMSELASLIDRRIGTVLTFEWWLSPESDLTCSYTFVPGKREVQSFYLDGLSPAEVTRTCDLVRGLFWNQPDVSDYLVVDAAGRSADFDWDGYLQYGVGVPATAPDLLIVGDATYNDRPDLPKVSALNARAEFRELTRSDWDR